MKQPWEATFEVPGDCTWRFQAGSEKEAREVAKAKFRAHPEWSARYPVTPAFTVRQVTRITSIVDHVDVVPNYVSEENEE